LNNQFWAQSPPEKPGKKNEAGKKKGTDRCVPKEKIPPKNPCQANGFKDKKKGKKKDHKIKTTTEGGGGEGNERGMFVQMCGES